MIRKKFKDCKIWTMERAGGSWACTIESPHNSFVHILSMGEETEIEAIANCKIKWKENYGKTNQKKITLHIPQT